MKKKKVVKKKVAPVALPSVVQLESDQMDALAEFEGRLHGLQVGANRIAKNDDELVTLEQQITGLQHQVQTLKQRYDEKRAKNPAIVENLKRQHDVVEAYESAVRAFATHVGLPDEGAGYQFNQETGKFTRAPQA